MKLPFKSPIKPLVSQEWGNTFNNAWYKENGVDIPFHNGTDFYFGTPKQTYGTPCVCPFKEATVVKVTWDTPTATKGNGVTIESLEGNKRYQLVFWHTGEIVVKLGQVIKEGEIICYVGNSGLCKPTPTFAEPFLGSHCHLMIFEIVNGNVKDYNNGVGGSLNCRLYFDFDKWYEGEDTGNSHDTPALTSGDYGFIFKFLNGEQIVKFLKWLGF